MPRALVCQSSWLYVAFSTRTLLTLLRRNLHAKMNSLGLHPKQVAGEVLVFIVTWLVLAQLAPSPQGSATNLLKWLLTLGYMIAKTFAVSMTFALKGLQSKRSDQVPADLEDRVETGD